MGWPGGCSSASSFEGCVGDSAGCDRGAGPPSLANGLADMLCCELECEWPAGGGRAGELGTLASDGAKVDLSARGEDEPHGEEPCKASVSAEAE